MSPARGGIDGVEWPADPSRRNPVPPATRSGPDALCPVTPAPAPGVDPSTPPPAALDELPCTRHSAPLFETYPTMPAVAAGAGGRPLPATKAPPFASAGPS